MFIFKTPTYFAKGQETSLSWAGWPFHEALNKYTHNLLKIIAVLWLFLSKKFLYLVRKSQWRESITGYAQKWNAWFRLSFTTSNDLCFCFLTFLFLWPLEQKYERHFPTQRTIKLNQWQSETIIRFRDSYHCVSSHLSWLLRQNISSTPSIYNQLISMYSNNK